VIYIFYEKTVLVPVSEVSVPVPLGIFLFGRIFEREKEKEKEEEEEEEEEVSYYDMILVIYRFIF